jgi:PAS domain S-box-containing protein
MNRKINILVVEDSEDDAILIVHMISKAGYIVNHLRLENGLDMSQALAEKNWDIILSDYSMPHFSGLDALEILKNSGLDIPFILISGTIGEETAVDAMKAGANDYIMKNNLKRLLPAIERELREAKVRAEHRKLEKNKQQADEDLHASEERFSTAFKYSPIACAIFREEDEVIVDANDAFVDISGYTIEEIIGKTTLQLGFYVNSTVRDKLLAKLADTGKVDSYEFQIKTKKGEIKDVLSAITFIILNNVKHYLAYVVDLTERNKSEKQLRILNAALEAAANAITITDINGSIIWLNQSFAKLTGYTKEEAIGHNPGELVNSGIHNKELYKEMWEIILSGKTWSGELTNKRKDNTLYEEFMTITPVKDTNGNISHFIAVKQDITQRKIAEIALQDSERKYRIIADNNYNWEFWTDPEGNFIYCSPSCYRVTGYKATEFIENNELIIKIIHPDYKEEYFNHIYHKLRHNEPTNFQYKIIHKDGSERWIEHICQPVYDEQGNYLGRRGNHSDITEKKETDRRILNAIISAEETQRNKFSQELHDGLGPVLSTVKLYFQWLADTTNPQKRKSIAKKGLSNIDEAFQTLREISNNLSPRVLTNLGLVPAIKHLISGINQTMVIKINFEYKEEKRYIPQIEITIYRVLSELIYNTMKYAKASNILISLNNGDGLKSLRIQYEDDGIGFDFPKMLESNIGLGIQNIIQRVKTLDGKIVFDTEEGHALKVYIELPISEF